MPRSGRVGDSAAGRNGRRYARQPRGRWILYLVPALAMFAVFTYLPVLLVLVLGFFDWNLISPVPTFVGLDNYVTLLTDGDFWTLILQTIFYIAVAIVGNFILPLLLAALTLSVGQRSSAIYQSVYFTPTVVATSVAALLWSWIYIPVGGMLNSALAGVGVSAHNWLNDPGTALVAVAVVANWKFFGFNFLVSLAGLRAIPRIYTEAAKIDGARTPAIWRYVLLPMLTPTLLFLLLTTILQALPNAFIPVQILTQGGPSGVSNNLLYAVFEDSFQFFQIGKSGAEAVMTMVLLGGAAIWQFLLLDKRLNYAE